MGLENNAKLKTAVEKALRRRKWQKVMAGLCAVVAAGTAYTFINPASTQTAETFCGYEEHKEHTLECFEKTLICEKAESEGHVHTEDCLGEIRTLICEKAESEGHVHTGDCLGEIRTLVCTLPETDGHAHTDGCFAEEPVLVCTLAETEGHAHTDGCYTEEKVLICADTDPEHVHGDGCYEKRRVLTCTTPEQQAHTHTDVCYGLQSVCVCGQSECQPHHHGNECYSVETGYVCGLEECEPHHHGDGCYSVETGCVCGLEECEEHRHTEDCYQIDKEHPICGKEIHEHTLQCFSDPSAVETPYIWERSFANVELTGHWDQDVIAIAETQLGYTESTVNYLVAEDGVTMAGYTRYGDWYADGLEYGEWCAMFCAFCMHYAGVDPAIVPHSASCPIWVNEISKSEHDLFREAGEYLPKPGDLVFFDWDSFTENTKRTADHVGLVYKVNTDDLGNPISITTIEGNMNAMVMTRDIELTKSFLLGYLSMPENPGRLVSFEKMLSNGVKVIAEMPVSSLPFPEDEVTLFAELVENPETEEFLSDNLTEEQAELSMMLIDVRLMHGDEEFEPIGPVSLSFETGDVFSPTYVYHVDEEHDSVTDMNGEYNSRTDAITVETDHFSIYGLLGGGQETPTIYNELDSATWDGTQFSSVILKGKGSVDKYFYRVKAVDGSGNVLGYGSFSGKTGKNTSVSLEAASLMSSATPDTRFYVEGSSANTGSGTAYTSAAYVTVYDIFDAAKPGFSDWLANDYTGSAPTTMAELNSAFSTYYNFPEVEITLRAQPTTDAADLWVDAEVSNSGTYSYDWQYKDQNGVWQTLTDSHDASINLSQCAAMPEEGAEVRAVITDSGYPVPSNVEFASPKQAKYDAIAQKLNTELHLSTWTISYRANDAVPSTKSVDITIDSDKFKYNFYYGNVLPDLGLAVDQRDPDNPDWNLPNAERFKNYLIDKYLAAGGGDAGVEAVRTIWNRYIYDIYDPSYDAGGLSNITATAYPGNTYGDQYASWPKEDKNYASFNNPSSLKPTLKSLDYSIMEEGVNYDEIIDPDTGLKKKVTLQSSEDRTYDVTLSATAQATTEAPVAMLIQVQTSWQMFDLYHANIVSGDGSYASIGVGAGARNTALCNLYSIKKALLEFVDYIQREYPQNNLVLGIMEFRHNSDSSLFFDGYYPYGESGTQKMYVTNDYQTIRNGLLSWNTFGNCEHVHYHTGTANDLVNATLTLEKNLSKWTDIADPIDYDDVRKVAVVLGGGTENSTDQNGLGCPLDWDSFQSAKLNSVYGIRVNEGTSLNNLGIISWLEHSSNYGTSKTPFADGEGNTYTSLRDGQTAGNNLLVATDADTLYNTLVEIAEKEMGYKAKLPSTAIFVENVTVTDTIQPEFELDSAAPITVVIKNSQGETVSTRTVATNDQRLRIIKENGITTVSYNFGNLSNSQTAELSFRIKAKSDYIGSNNVFSNIGTPELTYEHTVMNEDGTYSDDVKTYDVACEDTPEVNVPVRFSVKDGGRKSVFVNDPMNMNELDPVGIIKPLTDMADNYPQTNGTISFVWVMPDGTEKPVSLTVPVENGVPGTIPTAADFSAAYTPTKTGEYPSGLKATFTPDPVTDNGNFADSATAAAVPAVSNLGGVTIKAVQPGSFKSRRRDHQGGTARQSRELYTEEGLGGRSPRRCLLGERDPEQRLRSVSGRLRRELDHDHQGQRRHLHPVRGKRMGARALRCPVLGHRERQNRGLQLYAGGDQCPQRL